MALVAIVEATYQNVMLTYDAPASAARLTASRIGPSGTPAVVRGWSDSPIAGGSAVTIRDYEAPIGVPLTYTVAAENIGGTEIDAQTVDITVPSQGCSDTWLNDLARVGNTLKVILESVPELSYPVPNTAHEVITRRSPIVTSDVAHTAQLEVSILTESDDERERARALLGNGLPVLLRTPPEDGIGNMYLSVLDFREQRIVTLGTVTDRRFVISARHVSRPDPALYVPSAAVLYDDVRDSYSTYSELRAERATYDALLYGWTGATPSDIVPWPPDDV